MTEVRGLESGGDYDLRAKSRLLRNVLLAMWITAAIAGASSLLEPKNDLRVTGAVYSVTFLMLFGFQTLLRRGHVVLTGWVIAGFVWILIAFVTLFFGGLQGENAAVFGVAIMLLGGVGGGRAAVWLAILSSAWCGLMAVLEVLGKAPQPLGTYSPINAWTSITISLVLMSVLLRASLQSREELHARALASADERDAALRRSIQSQKMELVGSVASGIAHDFNNLLMVIGSAAQLLRSQLPAGSADAGASLDDLDAATSRAALMTRHLLVFGSAKGADLGATDVGALVRAFEPMVPRLVGSSIRLVVEAEPGLFVAGSRGGLEQILLNLAVNARDAMPEGGTLVIRAAADGEACCVLSVRDTGVGMDEATRARIFEPFFTTKSTGTGLGLATLHELVTRFGGAASVQSELGEGTTFEIRFPRIAAPRTAEIPGPPPAPARGQGERVLVVDDDPMVRRATARLLAPGFEVVTVANGVEALALLHKAKDFVCVVSDVSMPLLDGEALAAQLAEERPGLPVVLISGVRTPLASPSETPHRVFLEKPASREALLSAIARAQQG